MFIYGNKGIIFNRRIADVKNPLICLKLDTTFSIYLLGNPNDVNICLNRTLNYLLVNNTYYNYF